MMRKLGLLLFACICICMLRAQSLHQIKKDKWKGFERNYINIAGHEAYYVSPARPLAGKPWVWRASFPDWHTDMDSLLLSKGLFIAFVNVDNHYGDPYAMQVWDQFYRYLVDSLTFSYKVALEAVSRGGLYAYGWAKRNPDKVNFIYAEAPVCNINSWPGGHGSGIGDSASWKQLLSVYPLTDEEARHFSDNPFDHLEGLAAFKVPALHLINQDDKVVPVAENSDLLINNYTKLGGPAMVYPVTAGPLQLYNHHFPIEDPERWANMILSYCYPVKNPLLPASYISGRGGLNHSYEVFSNKKMATVAFLGGSITYNPGWRDKVSAYLRERFPKTDFHFIAAGIPSLGSLPHAFRLQRDVLDSGMIDLLFLEAAVNDRGNMPDSLLQIQSLEGIVRHARLVNPAMDIVLMSFADPDKNRDYDQGIIPVEVGNHERVAAHYGLPSVNLAREVHDKLVAHEFSWDYDFKDLHPSAFGQEIYFSAIKRLLEQCLVDGPVGEKKSGLAKAMNKGSFNNGTYISIEHAKLDGGWQLVNDWVPNDGLPTREGYVHVPMLVTEKPGSTLQFSFVGNAVGIAIISGADAGILHYSIDGGREQTVDLFTRWSSMLHLPWYLVLGKGLKNGNHVLKMKMASDQNKMSKGHACRIVYFLVNRIS